MVFTAAPGVEGGVGSLRLEERSQRALNHCPKIRNPRKNYQLSVGFLQEIQDNLLNIHQGLAFHGDVADLEPKFYKIIINLINSCISMGMGSQNWHGLTEERSWYGKCREIFSLHGTKMLQPPVPSPGPIKGLFVAHKKATDN